MTVAVVALVLQAPASSAGSVRDLSAPPGTSATDTAGFPTAESAAVETAESTALVASADSVSVDTTAGLDPVAPPENAGAASTVADAAVVQPALGDATVAAPQLTIAIDNGRTSTTTGDKLDYVITIANMGVTDIEGLMIAQSLPVGLTFDTADSGGVADAESVNWLIDLKATQTATFHTSGTVTATPAELLRLASVACARTAADSPPIVCAAHSDQLPAGAEAEANQAIMAGATTTEGQPWWYVPAGLAAALVIGGVVALILLRRRRPAAAEVPTP